MLIVHFWTSPKPMTGLTVSLQHSFDTFIPGKNSWIIFYYTKSTSLIPMQMFYISKYNFSIATQIFHIKINFFLLINIFYLHNHHFLISPYPTILKFHRPILILSTLTYGSTFPMTLSSSAITNKTNTK